MVTVKDLMRENYYSIGEQEKVRDLLMLFIEKQVTGVPVVDKDQNLVGMISDADILKQIKQPPSFIDFMTYIVVLDSERVMTEQIVDMLDRPVSELMTEKVITVEENTDVATVAQILSKRKFKKLPVVRGQKIIGIVSRSDVIRRLVQEFLKKSER